MMDFFINVLEILIWPMVVLILGLVIVLNCKKEIGALIDRIHSIGKRGLTTEELPPNQFDEKRKNAVDELMESANSAVLLEMEDTIKKRLDDRGIEAEGDAAKALRQHLAATLLVLDFEQTLSLIFVSQISLLKQLNQETGRGYDKNRISYTFGLIKDGSPNALKKWTLDQYLHLLFEKGLIIYIDDTYQITNKGIEFLVWLTKIGHVDHKPF
jgi:hypothetical protein